MLNVISCVNKCGSFYVVVLFLIMYYQFNTAQKTLLCSLSFAQDKYIWQIRTDNMSDHMTKFIT